MNGKFLKGALVGAIVSGLTVVSATAFAGNGIGAVFNLGRTNRVDAPTALSGTTDGPQLRVVNSSTGSTAAGIGIKTNAARPPLTVNSNVKVTNLDADLLDGLDSTVLQQRVTGTCPIGTAIATIGATGSVTCTSSAQFPIRETLANGESKAASFGSARFVPQCRFGGVAPGFIFVNDGGADASLDWMFSQGGASSTVNAQGQTVQPGKNVSFNLSGTRLEGQFIWSDAQTVVTIRIHVVVDSNRCDFSGTALVAAAS